MEHRPRSVAFRYEGGGTSGHVIFVGSFYIWLRANGTVVGAGGLVQLTKGDECYNGGSQISGYLLGLGNWWERLGLCVM